MKQDGGFVRLYRRIWDNPTFRSKQEASVFAWMISAAQWRETRIATEFGPIKLLSGEVLVAERVLSDDFGLHRNTVRRLIQRLVDAEMIELIRDRCPHRCGTVVSIMNYQHYQSSSITSDDAWDRSATEVGTEEGPKQDRSGTKNNEGKEGKEGKIQDTSCPSPAEPAAARSGELFPVADVVRLPDLTEEAVAIWNTMAVASGLSTVKSMNQARRASLRLRLKECGGLGGWRETLAMVQATPYLLGENDRGWKADFDFVLKSAKFAKIREGAYGNRGQAKPAAGKLGYLVNPNFRAEQAPVVDAMPILDEVF